MAEDATDKADNVADTSQRALAGLAALDVVRNGGKSAAVSMADAAFKSAISAPGLASAVSAGQLAATPSVLGDAVKVANSRTTSLQVGALAGLPAKTPGNSAAETLAKVSTSHSTLGMANVALKSLEQRHKELFGGLAATLTNFSSESLSKTFTQAYLDKMGPETSARSFLATPLGANLSHITTGVSSIQTMQSQLTAARVWTDPVRAQWRETASSMASLSTFNQVGSFAALQKSQVFDSIRAVLDLGATRPDALGVSGLAGAVALYGGVQRAVEELTGTHLSATLRGNTFQAARRVNAYLDGLPPKPIGRRATTAAFAARGVGTLVLAESLSFPDVDDEQAEATAVAAIDEMANWRDRHAVADAELMSALRDLNPRLPDYLVGAWADIRGNGAAAAVKAATCLLECLDHTLRAAAPNSSVLAWVTGEQPRGKRDFTDQNGKPTRQGRAAYILRHRPGRESVLLLDYERALIKGITPLKDELENAKHGPKEVPIAVLRLHAHALESLLMQLLLGY